MKPHEFIAFATDLANAADLSAAAYRSSVSRAYYGASHSVKSMLESLPVSLKLGTVSEHQVVQRLLISCKVAEAVDLGHQLGSLHELRKEADYELNDGICDDRDEAQLCVDRANAILAKLAESSSSENKRKIKAGIIQYRRDTNQ